MSCGGERRARSTVVAVRSVRRWAGLDRLLRLRAGVGRMALNDVEVAALVVWVAVHGLLLAVVVLRRVFGKVTGV